MNDKKKICILWLTFYCPVKHERGPNSFGYGIYFDLRKKRNLNIPFLFFVIRLKAGYKACLAFKSSLVLQEILNNVRQKSSTAFFDLPKKPITMSYDIVSEFLLSVCTILSFSLVPNPSDECSFHFVKCSFMLF